MKTQVENITVIMSNEAYYDIRRKFNESISDVRTSVMESDIIKNLPAPKWLKKLYFWALQRRVNKANERIMEFNKLFEGAPYPVELINF